MFQRKIGKAIALLCLRESIAIPFPIVSSRREIEVQGGAVEVDASQIHRRKVNRNDERQESHPFSADAVVGVDGYIITSTDSPDLALDFGHSIESTLKPGLAEHREVVKVAQELTAADKRSASTLKSGLAELKSNHQTIDDSSGKGLSKGNDPNNSTARSMVVTPEQAEPEKVESEGKTKKNEHILDHTDPRSKFYLPKVESFEGKWFSGEGNLVACNSSHCYTEDTDWREMYPSESPRGTLYGHTGWVAVAMNGFGVKWLKFGPDGRAYVQWWDRLPNTTKFREFVKTETYWMDTVGWKCKFKNLLLKNMACFENRKGQFANCKDTTIEDGVVTLQMGDAKYVHAWVLVDYSEEKSNDGNLTRRQLRWRLSKQARGTHDWVFTEAHINHPLKSEISTVFPKFWIDNYGDVFECKAQGCWHMQPPQFNHAPQNDKWRHIAIGKNRTENHGRMPIVLETFDNAKRHKPFERAESVDWDGRGVVWKVFDVDKELAFSYGKAARRLIKVNRTFAWYQLNQKSEFIKLVLLENSWFLTDGRTITPSSEAFMDDNGALLPVAVKGTLLGKIVTVGPWAVLDIIERHRGSVEYLEALVFEFQPTISRTAIATQTTRMQFRQAAPFTPGVEKVKTSKEEAEMQQAHKELEKLAKEKAKTEKAEFETLKPPSDPFVPGEDAGGDGKLVYGEDGEERPPAIDSGHVVMIVVPSVLILCTLAFMLRWQVARTRSHKKGQKQDQTAQSPPLAEATQMGQTQSES